jgi:branched-chain amino acid aminotransferase
MFSLQNSTVIFRQKQVPFSKANISIASSPVLYGTAVYTVCNVRVGANNTLYIFRLREHYKRLCESARIMDFTDFSTLYTYEAFSEAICSLLTANNVQEDVLVRMCVFIDELIAGTKTKGLTTSFSAYVYPMGQFYPKEGAHVCVSSWQRTPDNAIPSRAKINGSYANATLMKNEALTNGYDEAIALDAQGHVTEGTVANIFMVKNGVLITPDQSADILEGITRDTVLAIAKSKSIPAVERSIDRSELYTADELFYCGSSARVTPILSVDRRKVADGVAGSITQCIQAAYEVVQLGKDKDFTQWLTVVKQKV